MPRARGRRTPRLREGRERQTSGTLHERSTDLFTYKMRHLRHFGEVIGFAHINISFSKGDVVKSICRSHVTVEAELRLDFRLVVFEFEAEYPEYSEE